METRILELLKEPKNIQKEDLQILRDEIKAFPYLQSVRALHLYGIHLYESENYQKELSKTAAYTTDKKNLYHLINGNIERLAIEKTTAPAVNVIETKKVNPIYAQRTGGFPIKRNVEQTSSEGQSAYTAIQPEPEISNNLIFVEGQRNRILFDGEENFLNEENSEKIDIESSLEAGNLVTGKTNVVDNLNDEKQDEIVINQPEIEVLSQNNFTEEVEAIIEEKAISFQETPSLELNTQNEIKLEEKIVDEKELFTAETIISENGIQSQTEKEKIEDNSQLSFHGTESFLPEVKIESKTEAQKESTTTPLSTSNKYEDEMRRLIEQVEQKMKEAKKEVATKNVQDVQEEQEDQNSIQISYAETQSFEIETKPQNDDKEVQKVADEFQKAPAIESVIHEEKKERETTEEVKSDWKPMSFENKTLDSVIINEHLNSKQEEAVINQQEIDTKKTPELSEPAKIEQNKDVVLEKEGEEIVVVDDVEDDVFDKGNPGFNLSFFGNNISTFSKASDSNTEEAEPKAEKEIEAKTSIDSLEKASVLDSNVPNFINTWQSWLKIDRTDEIVKAKTEIKVKAIENFLENNPKISQLKDEVTFVVKEKTDDISHLMTETFAKLYTEQKLYTKAISAYQILCEKHPHKKSYFQEKIQEIKDLRGR
ncbi:hypothetical protein [Chryseobacterium sp.]|uniref:hypothetical protein n=1 Tax=Chryseobacterium sp. TaxID=1871047 RepID=UPI002FCA247E